MKVTLIGNQNSGKTTLFNLLTGSNQKVGNWPGVTIERKSGKIKGTEIEIVDLPGIYSLSPYTAEEEISRNYIIHENPDLIINIVDATSIERSLYLTTQLLELDAEVILALNMEDLLEKKGIKVNAEELSKQLGVKVVSISALKGTGIEELINIIKEWKYVESKKLEIYPQVVEQEIKKVEEKLNIGHSRFGAVKVLERDEQYKEFDSEDIEKSRKVLEDAYGTDTEEIIASLRYDFIVKVRDSAVDMKSKKETVTDKLDKVFLNKWAAIPIFACIMFLIYILSVGVVGSLTVDLVDGAVGSFSDLVASGLEALNASGWFVSLVCDGIIAGVGAMLNFVPQLIIMFICISLLEVTGYMSRISFFLDRVFKKFGLSGKSLIPFIVGSGCSVPGIMATRTIDSENEKKMTILLTPFIPCAAKLPIIALFAGAFFPKYSGLVSASLYFLAIGIILISALILKKFVYKGESSAFISELPEYKLPSFKYVARDVLEKIWAFIKRAGTIILLCSVVIWLLLSFTWTFKYTDADSEVIENVNIEEVAKKAGIEEFDPEVNRVFASVENGQVMVKFTYLNEDEEEDYTDAISVLAVSELEKLIAEEDKHDKKSVSVEYNPDDVVLEWKYSYGIDNSILAGIGKTFSWVFYPMLGELNWGAAVSAIQGLVAKEQVVASMSVIAGFGESVTEADGNILFSENSIFANFNPASAYAFMAFNLFSAPCFGAIGAMRREYGSTKRMLLAVLFQTGLAWLIGCLVFGIGSLLMLIF